VPFGLMQEWVNEDENVPIILNDQFIDEMGQIRVYFKFENNLFIYSILYRQFPCQPCG